MLAVLLDASQLFSFAVIRIAVNFDVATDALTLVPAHHFWGVFRAYADESAASKDNAVVKMLGLFYSFLKGADSLFKVGANTQQNIKVVCSVRSILLGYTWKGLPSEKVLFCAFHR